MSAPSPGVDFQGVVFPAFTFLTSAMFTFHVIRIAWFEYYPLLLWIWVPLPIFLEPTLADLIVAVGTLSSVFILIICIAQFPSATLTTEKAALVGISCFAIFGIAYLILLSTFRAPVIDAHKQMYETYGDRRDLIGYDPELIRNAILRIDTNQTAQQGVAANPLPFHAQLFSTIVLQRITTRSPHARSGWLSLTFDDIENSAHRIYPHTMIADSDISQMSVEERLKTIELLWTSLGNARDSIPSPEWHLEVLSERLAKIDSGEATFMTLSALRAKLQQPR